jgi:SAM-dependent methyltransferase
MEIHDLVTLSQGALAIMNPTTPEKVNRAGEAAGLTPESRVIEFGCGNGTILSLWAERFGISGLGIDIRPEACARASARIEEAGLSEKIRIRCMDASTFEPEDELFDCAASIGSSHIWGGFEPALDAMQAVVHEAGTIVIGDRFWRSANVPPDFARAWPDVLTGYEILSVAREAGFELAAIVRADDNDWDAYESGIWQCCLRWLTDNPDHPDRDGVAGYLRRIQEEYLGYGREYMGWAIFVLVPAVE